MQKYKKLAPGDSILDRLIDFAASVPDFRRTDKGNIRHRLGDIIMLMISARASKCVGRAEIIEFGRHNFKKLRKIWLLRNGVPSEPTLCRIENGINDLDMADSMQEFAQKYQRELPVCTPALGAYVRNHWSIESMHWSLDVNLLQDRIKRKSTKAARNLDSIQRIVHSIFSIWKGLRKKRSDKKKGLAELMRHVSTSFTRLLRFLSQK